jgi:hypothetical protein
MSKFNVTSARPAGRGPLATEAVPSGRTHEAGLATHWPLGRDGRDGRGTVTSQKDDGQNRRRCGASRA